MKKLWAILLVAALAAMSGNAMARNHYDNEGGDDNSVTCNGRGSCDQSTTNIDKSKTFNQGGKGGKGGTGYGGTGIGIGIGKGGNAKAYGGDADADAAAYAKSIGINYNSLTTTQQTSVKNYVSSTNAQGQGQVGIVKNVGPQVVIEDHSVITYEAAASSAIAPDVNAPNPTAQCRYSQGFSIAGSVVVGGGSIGHTTSEYDAICGLWMAVSQTTGEAKILATTAAYCLTMEEAGVEVTPCNGWRNVISGKPAEVEAEEVASVDAEGTWGR